MSRTVLPIILIAFTALIVFFYVKPTFESLRAVQDETNEYGEAVAKASEFNQLLNSLIADRNNMSAADLERMEAFLGIDVDETRLLVDLEAMASQEGMFFGNVNVAKTAKNDFLREDNEVPKNEVNERNFTPTNISFEVIGTYEQFRSLVAELERSLVLFEIENIVFQQNYSGALQQYKVSVTVRSFNTDTL